MSEIIPNESNELLKLYKRAHIHAKRSGFPHLADEFAQDVGAMKYCRIGQTMTQGFIDFLRDRYGRENSSKRDYLSKQCSLESLFIEPEARPEIDLIAFEDHIKGLPRRERIAVILRHVWGFTHKEIAHVFGYKRERSITAILQNAYEQLLKEERYSVK